jgi:restriction system protein
LKIAEDSLFGLLLRSRWWVSLAIAAALVLLSFVLLADTFRLIGIVAALPFLVICGMALRRQWGRPGAAQVGRITDAVVSMPWPAFAALLEASFRRDGCTVTRSAVDAFDFELERPGTGSAGRKVLVSARRWKAARTGIEPLRALQAARESAGAAGAIYICIRGVSDTARPYADAQGITLWQAGEVAHALNGLPLPAAVGGAR